jgi:hypothetical protein
MFHISDQRQPNCLRGKFSALLGAVTKRIFPWGNRSIVRASVILEMATTEAEIIAASNAVNGSNIILNPRDVLILRGNNL